MKYSRKNLVTYMHTRFRCSFGYFDKYKQVTQSKYFVVVKEIVTSDQERHKIKNPNTFFKAFVMFERIKIISVFKKEQLENNSSA